MSSSKYLELRGVKYVGTEEHDIKKELKVV